VRAGAAQLEHPRAREEQREHRCPRIVQPSRYPLADRRPVARGAVDAEAVAGRDGGDEPVGAPVGAHPPK